MLIAIALYVLIAAFTAYLPRYDGSAGIDVRAWSADAQIAVPWIGLVGWAVVATRWKGDGPVRDLRLRLRPRDAAWAVGYAVVGLVLASSVAAIQERVTGHSINSNAGDVLDTIKHASLLPVLVFQLLAIVGAPIVEEITFRGLLFGALEKRGMRTIFSVLISAGTFVLFHLEPTRILILTPIALALAITRARTNSTGASIVAHMTNNLIAIGALALAPVLVAH